jgi:hypothetical protein
MPKLFIQTFCNLTGGRSGYRKGNAEEHGKMSKHRAGFEEEVQVFEPP